MIRFYNRHPVLQNEINFTIASEQILAGENIWREGKAYFRQNLSDDAADIHLLPVVNEKQEVICHAYQDNEANRELRMLKELMENSEALQFQDIFPEIWDVLVCGCNELAYHFVQYLEKQQIPVTVAGKYWELWGYEGSGNFDVDNEHTLVVHAEDIIPETSDLYQTVIRSASPAFECINEIYEANVLEGKIKDAKGNLETFFERIEGKDIVILGTDINAQDTYDFLYGHGIDICCFAEWKDAGQRGIDRTLLGKKILGIEEVVNGRPDVVFIDGSDRGSALGTACVETLGYYGYARNRHLFLIQDYTEVPYTNLLHVLKEKKVFLAGDEYLCAMLSEYLLEMEQGKIDLAYVALSQCEMMKETDILCVVSPWFNRHALDWRALEFEENPKVWRLKETLSEQGNVSYTDYFAQIRTLVLVDLYRNKDCKKYSVKELLPRGILLGRIPFASGNIFFRGLLDGHPNILQWEFDTQLNFNLFLYCIRLAGKKSDDIYQTFTKMCREELAFQWENEFADWDAFEKSLKRLLSMKESFTSQELFVVFHVAFTEMLCGYKVTDLNAKIIYWEPHMFPREDFDFLAQWLEDKQICGKTICMHRDHIVWSGSAYGYFKKDGVRVFTESAIPGVAAEKMMAYGRSYQYWEEFYARFEDIKLHPKRELRKLCGRLGIPWSDTMMQATQNGEAWNYYGRGIYDFDLKPVFNKYEEFLSAFDRFRISLISSPYQKKYGYTYEDCMKFSRKELQEMFLKEFRFQTQLRFEREQDKAAYFLRTCKILMIQLWKVRRHMLLDDIISEFGEIEIGESRIKKKKKAETAGRKELDRLLRFVHQEERLVLYGTGRDCEGLMGHLGEKEQERLIFSDLKAEYMEKSFHGRRVVAPRELNGRYKDYKILITSSQFCDNMRQRLEDMGVSKERITCNRFQLWEEEA